jgi:hypothetical protein
MPVNNADIDPCAEKCYIPNMTDAKAAARVSSWAVPTKADDEAWARMTRDEQLAAYKELFNSPAATDFTNITVAEIVERSRTARKTKQAADGQKL